MGRILSFISAVWRGIVRGALALWRRFRALPLYGKIIVVIILLALLGGLIVLSNSGSPTDAGNGLRTVTLESVSELGGTGSGADVIGTVRSVDEADLVAQTSGQVKSVNATVGDTVAAGAVLASLENATEAAQVTQAQGAYDAALAARAGVSSTDASAAAVNAYRNAYATLDIALSADVDQLFGAETATGPQLLINPNGTQDELSRMRESIKLMMTDWNQRLAAAGSRDPGVLLDEAAQNLSTASSFLDELARIAGMQGSGASSAQLSALGTARSTVAGLVSSVASARSTYRSQSSSSNAGATASVKQAQGSLALAEANYEKTVIRAPIAGTVNFLPLHVGDYVSATEPVATIAQNGALEIDTSVSADERTALLIGARVKIEGQFDGVITSIAPALNPTTKQIDVRIAVGLGADLVNGQSVHISLPAPAGVAPTTTTASTTPAILLPLAAVKLGSESRTVFTVGNDNRLIAVPVILGDVEGDRIVVSAGITLDMRIVTDARGLSDGELVNVASSTAP